MATKSRIEEVHNLWITAGMGCDGDTVSITAATQPDIEDILLGAIPGLPKVHLHNPVLAFELGGDSFMAWWYKAERGELDPFVLVVEGSIPNEKIKSEGYWAALGTDPVTNQPITTNEWVDRLAPKALAVVAHGGYVSCAGVRRCFPGDGYPICAPSGSFKVAYAHANGCAWPQLSSDIQPGKIV